MSPKLNTNSTASSTDCACHGAFGLDAGADALGSRLHLTVGGLGVGEAGVLLHVVVVCSRVHLEHGGVGERDAGESRLEPALSRGAS